MKRGIGVGTGWAGWAAAPPSLRAGGNAPPTLTENFTLEIFQILFLFIIGIFKIKWPKSEEELEFGGR